MTDLSSCDWPEYLSGLLRDVNGLLNTRTTLSPAHLKLYPQVSRSVLAFGLPEVSRTTVGDERGIQELALALTEVIRRYEPRLSRPHVTMSKYHGGSLLQFRLEAQVLADPAPIKLVFDTTYNANAGHYHVEGRLDEG